MSVSAAANWTYYVSSIEDKLYTLNMPSVGFVNGVLDLKLTLAQAKNTEVVVCDGLFSRNSVMDSTVVFRAVSGNQQANVSIDLRNFQAEIQVFDIWLLDSQGKSLKAAKLICLPLKQPMPEVCFVVGSPRSGTTAVGKLVQLAYDVKSHNEAHVGEIFSKLVKSATEYFSHSSAAMSQMTLTQQVSPHFVEAQLVLNLRDLYLRYYPNQNVVDKTPGVAMIESLPLMLKAFPNAKFVYCKRRALENIVSRLIKFEKVPFEGHCRQWNRSIVLWQQIKNHLQKLQLQDTRFIEIEQFELANNADHVIGELLEFLQVDTGRFGRLTKYVKNNSPQKTSDSSSKALRFDELKWTNEQKEFFLSTCGKAMEKMGYSLDESYYR